jgi:hypothetical protein
MRHALAILLIVFVAALIVAMIRSFVRNAVALKRDGIPSAFCLLP